MKTPRKPREVGQVFRALKANANAAGLPPTNNTLCYSDGKEWMVGSNSEDGSHTMVFRDEKWFYRDPWTGDDKPMKGGLAEALGNCDCWFTG